MADVRVMNRATKEIHEMSEESFNLMRHEYQLVGVEAKVNQRPVIAPEPTKVSEVPIKELVQEPAKEQPKQKPKTKAKK